jgi:uroporphyrinogen-III synthase
VHLLHLGRQDPQGAGSAWGLYVRLMLRDPSGELKPLEQSLIGTTVSGGASSIPGGRVAVTRPGGPGELGPLLEGAGLVPVGFPLLAVRPSSGEDLSDAIFEAGRDGARWILLVTSPRTVPMMWRALRARGGGEELLRHAEIWAIGPGTARALERIGLSVDLVPQRYVAEGLLEVVGPRDLRNVHVILPRAAEGRPTLPSALREKGARVTEVSMYTSVPQPEQARQLLLSARGGDLRAVLLTAASQVGVLHDALDDEGERGGGWPASVPLIGLGPVVAAEAEKRGLPLSGFADPHTFQGLVAFLVRHLRR